MKILLHVCCAPCATYPFQSLRQGGHRVEGFFYNPNIQPYREYLKRREAVLKYAAASGNRILLAPEYDFREYLRMVVSLEDVRCWLCYLQRMRKTAAVAREGRFDAFTTTLLLSKHQKHDEICSAAEEAAREQGICFYYQDFRPGWKEHWALTEEFGLYKQQYCGCIYSEYERYKNMEI